MEPISEDMRTVRRGALVLGRYDDNIRKRDALNKADSAGEIADSMEVRTEIMERVHAGKITLKEGQAELRKIKRSAKKNGQLTRQQKCRLTLHNLAH